MMYVNDEFYDNQQFGEFYRQFDAKPEIRHCRGRRLAICLSNTAQTTALVLYLRERGGSVVPLHPTMPLEAARRAASNAESHILIYDDIDHIEILHPTSGTVPAGLVQFSSGSTGEPKRIERSWEDIDEEIKHYNAALQQAKDMTPVVTCPITHSYGLLCGVLSTFKRGQQPLVLTELNPKYVLRKLRQTPNALLYSSPTMLNVLTKLLPANESLYAVMTSGSVLPAPQFKELSQKTQFLFQQYGCSEAGCIAVNLNTQSANGMGQPLGHLTVKASGNSDTPSEIVVSTGQKQVATQDLGYFDNQGVLHFMSRLDDTINVAGINVYPQEVEDVLLTYPEITDAVVFKKPDQFAGERVCLKFVADKTISQQILRDWCAQKLSPYQLPVDIEQVEVINKLANGKVNRRLLAQEQIDLMQKVSQSA
ncbi:AMP-binding protein [Methylophaga thiooxydans]|uniref:AMP-binding enzyme, putative n=1 Tax=Methylophaga thiooxydans DMS010 TaxID=637616 RepID=C0N4Q8_9GAMM|nr:AMP-binding protein [Methylophaga thiooxydans]EEF80232.1 AMP-binding enzyme, putative [Methylophaga thiooxydans DMS010]